MTARHAHRARERLRRLARGCSLVSRALPVRQRVRVHAASTQLHAARAAFASASTARLQRARSARVWLRTIISARQLDARRIRMGYRPFSLDDYRLVHTTLYHIVHMYIVHIVHMCIFVHVCIFVHSCAVSK